MKKIILSLSLFANTILITQAQNPFRIGSDLTLSAMSSAQNNWQRFCISYGIEPDGGSGNYKVTDTQWNQATFSHEGNGFVWATHEGALSNPQTLSQWDSYKRMILTNNGYLGIGTINPQARLQVGDVIGRISLDYLQWSNADLGWNSSYIGFNTTRVEGNKWATVGNGSHNGAIAILGNSSGEISFSCLPSTGGSNASYTDAQISAAIKMKINSDGSVGINTAPLWQYKLAVNGGIICEEVTVKLKANWPDFVFNKNHKLKTLPEVEAFIKENNHLPGIPSAAEVKQNGIAVSDMQTKQMQKIEELTLYLIEANKTIEQQNQRLAALEKIVGKK
jgi:hypothetical protein